MFSALTDTPIGKQRTVAMFFSFSVVWRSCKCRNEQPGLAKIVQDAR